MRRHTCNCKYKRKAWQPFSILSDGLNSFTLIGGISFAGRGICLFHFYLSLP